MKATYFWVGDDSAVSFFPLCFSLFAFHLGLCLNFPGWLSFDNDHREYTNLPPGSPGRVYQPANKIGSAGMAVPHLTVALFPWILHALCPVDVRETNI